MRGRGERVASAAVGPGGTSTGLLPILFSEAQRTLTSEERARMYKGTKVLDVHGHVTAPNATSNYIMLIMSSNTPMPNPLLSGRPGPGLSGDDFKAAAQTHATYMDERY